MTNRLIHLMHWLWAMEGKTRFPPFGWLGNLLEDWLPLELSDEVQARIAEGREEYRSYTVDEVKALFEQGGQG